MGKTYKTQSDEYFVNDFSDYDLDESDYDDEIDSWLLDGAGKRHRSKRNRHANRDRHASHGVHTIPSDWFDSDSADTGNYGHWR